MDYDYPKAYTKALFVSGDPIIDLVVTTALMSDTSGNIDTINVFASGELYVENRTSITRTISIFRKR